MTYRSEPCAFCELTPVERCPRCQVGVCAAHGGSPHCWACRKELKDDLDVARFTTAVHEAPPDSRAALWNRRSAADAFQQLWSWVEEQLARRRVERAFAARSIEDIAAWRRSAGVRTRGWR